MKFLFIRDFSRILIGFAGFFVLVFLYYYSLVPALVYGNFFSQ